jgi:hypothetical protein
MATPQPVRVERRSGLRFSEYQIPALLKASDGRSGAGFTLDLSSRGALLWTDFPVAEGDAIEIMLVMPAEITLAEDMSVRCHARVVRLQHDRESGKPAVAVKIDHYEFLPREFAAVQHRSSEELSPVRP